MSCITPVSLYFSPLYQLFLPFNWVIVFFISLVISDWVMPWNVYELIYVTDEIRVPTLIWCFLVVFFSIILLPFFRLVVIVSVNGKLIMLSSWFPSLCCNQYYSVSHGVSVQSFLSLRNNLSWQKLSIIIMILQLSEIPNLPFFTILSNIFARPNRTYQSTYLVYNYLFFLPAECSNLFNIALNFYLTVS